MIASKIVAVKNFCFVESRNGVCVAKLFSYVAHAVLDCVAECITSIKKMLLKCAVLNIKRKE